MRTCGERDPIQLSLIVHFTVEQDDPRPPTGILIKAGCPPVILSFGVLRRGADMRRFLLDPPDALGKLSLRIESRGRIIAYAQLGERKRQWPPDDWTVQLPHVDQASSRSEHNCRFSCFFHFVFLSNWQEIQISVTGQSGARRIHCAINLDKNSLECTTTFGGLFGFLRSRTCANATGYPRHARSHCAAGSPSGTLIFGVLSFAIDVSWGRRIARCRMFARANFDCVKRRCACPVAQ